MKIYNSLTHKIESFVPISQKFVSMYSCGPTVYDYYHIGNLRNAIFNDTLRRSLEASGYSVHHVVNITDVGHLVSDTDEGEDKLEKGAMREKKSVQEVAEYYTNAFKEDMKSMNVLTPNAYHSPTYKDNYARATEFIPQQQDIIQKLLDNKHAYITPQAIYFDVSTVSNYGELSGQKLLDKKTHARSQVVEDSNKKHPYDFAIWFFTVDRFKNHSMSWDTPWGQGFPGWHLECSAIIHALLGDPVDIHTGGVDHIGTHHPNEIAQTIAAYGHKLANYWVHNEFMLVDGAKMSKSKNNSYTLKNLYDNGFDALDYRMMVLQAHYRSELNFSWSNLEASKTRLHTIRNLAQLTKQPAIHNDKGLSIEDIEAYSNKIYTCLQIDLNTPAALAELSAFTNLVDTLGIAKNAQKTFTLFFERLDELFGLKLLPVNDISSDQKSIINGRATARSNNDWATSDKLRQELEAQGIVVKDTELGQIWSRL